MALRVRAVTRVLVLAGTCCMLALAGHHGGGGSNAAASSGSDAAVPATKDDLPRMGVNGAPVLAVDGRICRFPWIGPDGVRHTTCASLQASGDDSRLWCKDINDLWAICAAPKGPAPARHGSRAGGSHQGSAKADDDGTAGDPGAMPAVLSTSPSPGASVCLCAMLRALPGRAALVGSTWQAQFAGRGNSPDPPVFHHSCHAGRLC